MHTLHTLHSLCDDGPAASCQSWSCEDNKPVAMPGASTSTGRYLNPIIRDKQRGKRKRKKGIGIEISRDVTKRCELLDSALPERLPLRFFFSII